LNWFFLKNLIPLIIVFLFGLFILTILTFKLFIGE
jgi:hypothetical protein